MRLSFVSYPEYMEPVYGIHVSEELPLFSWYQERRRGRRSMHLSRESCLETYAARLAVENRGRFSVEMVSPRKIYQRFLEDIIFLPGIVRIMNWTRYTIYFEVARCFDPVEVLRAAGRCLHHYFYSEAELFLENDGAITQDLPKRKVSHDKPSREVEIQ